MLHLVVEVAGEPVVEPRPLDVTRRRRLSLEPRLLLVVIDPHRDVVTLRDEHEPEALEQPVRENKTTVV